MLSPLSFDHGFSKASPQGNYMLDGITPKEEAEEVLEGLCQECHKPINNANTKLCDECLMADERGER